MSQKDLIDKLGNTAYPDSKASVRVATTENIELKGLPIIDGVQVVDNNRVLVKNQSDATKNGIYVVTDQTDKNGYKIWTRSEDCKKSEDVTCDIYLFVEEGNINQGTGWINSSINPVILDTSPIYFVKFTSHELTTNEINAIIDAHILTESAPPYGAGVLKSELFPFMMDQEFNISPDGTNTDFNLAVPAIKAFGGFTRYQGPIVYKNGIRQKRDTYSIADLADHSNQYGYVIRFVTAPLITDYLTVDYLPKYL